MDVLFSTFVVLLIVIDPIGNAPMFMALTHNMEAGYRRTMAIRGVSLATAILLVFLLIGDTLLALLGIGISAFRIAGGILLFLLAIDMVFARQSGLRSTTVQE
jgi:multiple antibiotic resistance protein